MQVLLGIKYIHDQGIYHEEMILRKVMVVEEDGAYSPIHVKLSDLMSFVMGAEKNKYAFHINSDYMTTMAPEVFDFGTFSKKSLIWPLGTLLYNLCDNGEPLFFGKPNQVKQSINARAYFYRINAL